MEKKAAEKKEELKFGIIKAPVHTDGGGDPIGLSPKDQCTKDHDGECGVCKDDGTFVACP